MLIAGREKRYMGEPETGGCSHAPEPREGSILNRDGRRADLFNPSHYPVRAVCRFCGEPIEAGSFFWPFAHAEVSRAAVYQFPVRGVSA